LEGTSGGSRAAAPTCERRTDARLYGGGPADRSEGRHGTERTVTPVHVRLYQDKDDRHRRREEARVRQMEDEEDEIRYSAFKALRCPLSPCRRGRSASPSRVFHSLSPISRQRRRETPPRQGPPLPVKSARSVSRRRQPDEAHANGTQRTSAPFSDLSTDAHLESEMAATSILINGSMLVPTQGTSHMANGGDSSVFSDDLPSLRVTVQQQKQRIEFLEAMHQKVLTQLRKEREEIVAAQQQRFHTENKMLQLEQLFSEMQARTFEGTLHMRLLWEGWLSRSSVIFAS